tara:strand:+ start:20960 stop:22051 length:1092 start_codon:yes stop_codon:yes gene_type:complete
MKLICYLFGAFLLGSCQKSNEEKATPKNKHYCLDEAFKSKIELEKPKNQNVTVSIPLTGVIEPNPNKVIHFRSLVSGIISNTFFSLGDIVSKGQVLAELRSTDLSELQSRSKIVSSQLIVAERELQSVQSMFDDGIASQKDLLVAHSEQDALKAELERINANLSLYSASLEKGVFQIKSPTAGIVTGKSIAAGNQISTDGESLFTISDLDEVWVMVNVYAANVKNIQKGMKVNIKTLSYPDEFFNGEIEAISPILDTEARVLKARVVLKNTDYKLKPGMIVDVIALKDLKTEALSISTSALVFDNNQNFVVIHNSDCEIEIRQVNILSNSRNKTFLSKGINDDEIIISKNHLLIYEQIKNFQN